MHLRRMAEVSLDKSLRATTVWAMFVPKDIYHEARECGRPYFGIFETCFGKVMVAVVLAHEVEHDALFQKPDAVWRPLADDLLSQVNLKNYR